MKNESFRRSFSMLCAAVGLIVLMGIAVAGQMESTEQQNQKLLSENQKLTEENERLEKDLNNWKIAKEIKEAPAVRLKEDSENWMLALVNEEYPLAKDYTPASLTKLDEKCSVDTRIYGELEQMIADARQAGQKKMPCTISVFRSVRESISLLSDHPVEERQRWRDWLQGLQMRLRVRSGLAEQM